MTKQQPFNEDMAALKQRVSIAETFGWAVVSGLTATVWREKGEDALNKVWRRLMAAEQKERFVAALEKLGIVGDTPAVTAAKYHYFSNSIGGLNMQYIEESPRKVWIRYLPPWGSYPGISALAVPSSVRRTILTTWHPRNGELLGCPRLGWVATKFVVEGHPYDEGYFYEYDHDLSSDERFVVRHEDKTPEFDAARAPRLDPVLWPEARIMKGSANYASDYVKHAVETVVEHFGLAAATDMLRATMKTLAIQFVGNVRGLTGSTGNDVAALAGSYATILRAFKNDVRWESTGQDTAELEFSSLAPFPYPDSEAMREAVFAYFHMGVRVANGHILLERRRDCATARERWVFTDTKQWLW
ncbi:Uncharacterised protein [Bordetella ansorpii]|uniref:Uncharacterized protein n=1 Tax=Bordetella ansorpii TaxID=288768 RepID=A0A157LY58_9BORD|nr:hypothetical protein [Bordetella ansorpii]SAI01384.1 Uncharacterised protein [Bordetella ansorpii]